MIWDQKDAENIYEELRRVSAIILKRLGFKPEPWEYNGVGKTRTNKWEVYHGKRTWRGILYHYTNGVSMAGAMGWTNDPRQGNTGSSWNTQISDRLSDDVIGEEWNKLPDELLWLFPVPTIIMADHRWGTWHGNWTCGKLLGVENRNGGYSGYRKHPQGLKGLGKEGVKIGSRIWEPYTREQIICNVNYGKMVNGMSGSGMDPDWILTHQCVWGTKNDCGPLFPIHGIRDAIFGNDKLSKFIPDFMDLPSVMDRSSDEHQASPQEELSADVRSFDAYGGLVEDKDESDQEEALWSTPEDIKMLRVLGYNATDTNSKKFVEWFQRSIHALKDKRADANLDVDGVLGPETRKFLVERSSFFI